MVAAREKQQAASCVERGVVATLWQSLEQLMFCDLDSLDASVWLLMSALPNIETIQTQELQELALLHRSSATNLMATIRLVAPSAFEAGASKPDQQLLSQLDSSILSMVSCLVELQLFHLQRAAVLSTTSRHRQQQGEGIVRISCDSNCSSKVLGPSTGP